MNILFYYTQTINPKHGGIAQVTFKLGEFLRKKGYTVYYLSKRKTNNDLTAWQFYLPKASKNENKKYFLDFIKLKNIQLIINQNGISPSSEEAIIWSREAQISLVTVMHNSLFGIYGINNHLKGFRSVLQKVGLLKRAQSLLLGAFRYKYGQYYKRQVEYSDRIILLSDKFIPEYCFFSGLPTSKASSKILSIPNPTSLPNEVLSIMEKRKEILFVGRLSPEKQVDLLLDIWAKVQPRFENWQLTIVGDGTERDALEKKVKMADIKNVTFEGFRKPDDYYKRASLFCMTSAFEGFGMVLTEAMSYGTIPLAFKSYANVTDIIDDEKNGVLITPFSIDEYAEKLSHMMSDQDKMQKMSIAAIEKSKNYSIEKIGKRWIELIKELIAV